MLFGILHFVLLGKRIKIILGIYYLTFHTIRAQNNDFGKFSQGVLITYDKMLINNYTGKEDLQPIMDNGKIEEQKMTGNVSKRDFTWNQLKQHLNLRSLRI